ncbi:MAG: hypothetical protein ACPL4I_12010 [Bacteroidota bacterium]|jgi:hypothetical protein
MPEASSVRTCQTADRQAQTGNVPIRPRIQALRGIHRYEGHGVEYHPKVTENGHTEQGNPSGALSARKGMEQATRPQALTE